MEIKEDVVVISVGDIIETEFGIGPVKGISDSYVVQDIFEQDDEICVSRKNGGIVVPCWLKGDTPPNVGIGDYICTSSTGTKGKIKLITEQWVILEDEKNGSEFCCFLSDESFFLPQEIEWSY